MAKFYDAIGYAETKETAPGVWREETVEYFYKGDVTRNTKRYENGEGLNDNLSVNVNISIVADQYAFQHWFNIRYVRWNGAKWKVREVDATQRPRLILTLGGIYNGN